MKSAGTALAVVGAQVWLAMIEGGSAFERADLNYLQMHLSSDELERLRVEAANSSVSQEIILECANHLSDTMVDDLQSRLPHVVRTCVGLISRCWAASAIVTILRRGGGTGATVMKHVGRLMLTALNDRSTLVRKVF